ncbi:hypothetical protein ES703_98840 [subsurface metagenome]
MTLWSFLSLSATGPKTDDNVDLSPKSFNRITSCLALSLGRVISKITMSVFLSCLFRSLTESFGKIPS